MHCVHQALTVQISNYCGNRPVTCQRPVDAVGINRHTPPIYMYVFVCMYVRIYVRKYECIYVCMYACMYVCMLLYVCMYVCMYVRTYVLKMVIVTSYCLCLSYQIVRSHG